MKKTTFHGLYLYMMIVLYTIILVKLASLCVLVQRDVVH